LRRLGQVKSGTAGGTQLGNHFFGGSCKTDFSQIAAPQHSVS